MRLFVAISLVVISIGTTLTRADDDPDLARVFQDVIDTRSYWERELEITVRREGIDPASLNPQFKRCYVDETVSATSDYLKERIAKFLDDKSNGNYAMVQIASQEMVMNGRSVDAETFGSFARDVCQKRTVNSH